jgi:hypothetical protein
MNRREMMASVAAVASGVGAKAKVIDTPPACFVIEVPGTLRCEQFNRMQMELVRLSERMKQNNGHGPEFLMLEQGAKLRMINHNDTLETPENCDESGVGRGRCVGNAER